MFETLNRQPNQILEKLFSYLEVLRRQAVQKTVISVADMFADDTPILRYVYSDGTIEYRNLNNTIFTPTTEVIKSEAGYYNGTVI